MSDSNFLAAFFSFEALLFVVYAVVIVTLKRKGYTPPSPEFPIPTAVFDNAYKVGIFAFILLATYRIPGGMGSAIMAFACVLCSALASYLAISAVARLPRRPIVDE